MIVLLYIDKHGIFGVVLLISCSFTLAKHSAILGYFTTNRNITNQVKKKSKHRGAVTRGNFFLQLATQIWVKKILQAPVEL